MTISSARAAQRLATSSKAHEHRLGFKMNVPEFFDALLDVLFQSQDVSGGSLSRFTMANACLREIPTRPLL